MWQGTGVAASLWGEGKRAAERAVEGFFANQRQSFVLDAGATIEYLLKFAVANRDPSLLYHEDVRRHLTETELRLLNRHSSAVDPPIAPDDLDWTLDVLVERKTIGPIDARELVNAPEFLNGAVPTDACERVRKARNRGAHLGEFNVDADGLAADLLAIVDSLTPTFGRPCHELWGTWNDVADPDHMTSKRTPTAEMQVRCCRARTNWYANLLSIARRSRYGSDTNRQVTCPVCSNSAVISRVGSGDAPSLCLEADEHDTQLDALDCFHCGLILFGWQIERAQEDRPAHYGDRTRWRRWPSRTSPSFSRPVRSCRGNERRPRRSWRRFLIRSPMSARR